MLAEQSTNLVESSQLDSIARIKLYACQLQQDLQQSKLKLKEVSDVKYYDSEAKKNISFLENKVLEIEKAISEVDRMLDYPPGSWVIGKKATPGKVVDLVIAGSIPEVHVEWYGHTVPVPERPMNLSLVKPEDMEYIWNGDHFPKLVRRIDQHECDEIEVLSQKLTERIACKKLAIEHDSPADIVREYQLQETYCKKRIAWVNAQDLSRLEHTIKQGLEVFYRVGEALMQIRDRKLYKELGYSNFKDYCIERWNMGRSQAYRLIDSAEVVSNIVETKKSVPNWGQNLATPYQSSSEPSVMPMNKLPKSESVARELLALPKSQQVEAWDKAVESTPDGQPTAAITKAVVKSMMEDKDEATRRSSLVIEETSADVTSPPLIAAFKVDQIVRIESDRTDKRLIGYNKAIAVVTKVHSASVDLKLWGQRFVNVSPSDLKVIDSVSVPAICFNPALTDLAVLINGFESTEEIIKAALAYLAKKY